VGLFRFAGVFVEVDVGGSFIMNGISGERGIPAFVTDDEGHLSSFSPIPSDLEPILPFRFSAFSIRDPAKPYHVENTLNLHQCSRNASRE
jgi:hypothetical protein